jgi:DNA-binding GntR family transcriptional regulator
MTESICPVIEGRIQAPLTRYMELRQTLAAEIAAGAFAVGAKFPTEYELCDRFSVSRHTVREALRALEDQGLLARQAGLGTTVLARTPAALYTSTLDSLGGLHDYATETAFEKQNEGFVTIRGGLAEILGREPGERWLRFAGPRRMVSGAAICWTEIFVGESYSAERGRLVSTEAPVYEIVARQFGLEIREVEQRVSALAMPPEIAKALDAEAHKPALMTRRRYFADGDTPFEISLSIHPGDRYAYTQRLRREGAHK